MKPYVFSRRFLVRSGILICGSICCFCCIAHTQDFIFVPAKEDTMLLKKRYNHYEHIYLQELTALPEKNKNDYERVYKERWQFIKDKFDRKEIYTSAIVQQYLDDLTNEIRKSNSLLQNHVFECWFSRSYMPNASYIGEGIILFNMGLFERLNNESEAAFIICHEIAHYVMKHSEKRIDNYVTAINSENVQRELEQIKGSEYRKREQLEKLVTKLSFSSKRHERDHESEADSLAVELMHNTRFDVKASLSTINLLDTIDIDTLNVADCLKKTFNFPAYPFQQKWIRKEEGLLGGHAKLLKDESIVDSLKTHPECKVRIKMLEPLVNKYASVTGAKDIINKERFDSLKNIFRYEIIAYAFSSQNFTRSFFYTLELLQEKPSDPYLIVQLGKVFNSFYAFQKSHKLTKVIEFPSPVFPDNYNLLLQFVQNLYLDDYASLSYHYLSQYSEQFGSYPPFKNEYSISIMTAKQ
jgi:Zn-dependent protease with chaperone function